MRKLRRFSNRTPNFILSFFRTKKAFKRSLKEMLLDFLETEDSYIDVDTIIVKMKK